MTTFSCSTWTTIANYCFVDVVPRKLISECLLVCMKYNVNDVECYRVHRSEAILIKVSFAISKEKSAVLPLIVIKFNTLKKSPFHSHADHKLKFIVSKKKKKNNVEVWNFRLHPLTWNNEDRFAFMPAANSDLCAGKVCTRNDFDFVIITKRYFLQHILPC